MTAVDFISGHTYHGRKGDISNAFRYSVDYVLLDSEAKLTCPMLFSRNRGNLTALHDRDHGGEVGNGRGAAWAREVLESHQIRAQGKLLLMAQPRMLGHVFNPVSFWLAHDTDDNIVAVICEVNNTFGDRHSYLCVKPDRSPITRSDKLSAKKIFHVSPFQPIEGGYTFRFDITEDRIGIWIDYGQECGGLIATLTGPRRALTNGRVLKSALRRPFGSRRVLALIHWQALKLWWKGAKYRAHTPPPREDVSQ